MKDLSKTLLFTFVFFLSSTAFAGNNDFSISDLQETKCSKDKKKAKKAKKLYTVNKKKAKKIHYKLQNLVMKQKRQPASVAKKKKVKKMVKKLELAKRKKMMKVKRYLMKHKQFKQSAKKSCSEKPEQTQKFNPLMMDKYADMAGA